MKTRVYTPVPFKHFFSGVAFWQLTIFVMLLLMVWINEVHDLSALVYKTAPRPFCLLRGSLLSAFVLTAAIISIGQTYLTQRRALSGILTVCSKCHKVRVEQMAWKELVSYITDHSEATFSHGLCPVCAKKEMDAIEAVLGSLDSEK